MRWILFPAAAVGLVAAVFLLTSSSASRPQPLPGSVAAAVASLPPSSPAQAPPSSVHPAPAREAMRARTSIEPADGVAPPQTPINAFGSAGLVLVVDPETGRPGLPEAGLQRALTIAELQELARAEAEGLATIRNADGSETLNHEGRFTNHSIARVGRDGKVVHGCVHGEGELEHAMHATPPAKSAAEEN
jgi:hypothetical protein